jgi:hypothetical protein
MKFTPFIPALAALVSVCSAATTTKAISTSVTFDNNRRFLFDTDGKQIDAYGSKVNNFNGKYYLYGNSFSETGVAYGIKSYSSVDLVNWYVFSYPTTPLLELLLIETQKTGNTKDFSSTQQARTLVLLQEVVVVLT